MQQIEEVDADVSIDEVDVDVHIDDMPMEPTFDKKSYLKVQPGNIGLKKMRLEGPKPKPGAESHVEFNEMNLEDEIFWEEWCFKSMQR